jgi:hypothetical protein
LSVLGGVFTDKVIVQHMTGFRWMAVSSTEEDIRIYHNARVLVALRICLKKLEEFYKTLDPPSFYDHQPHPRYFPHPTSFTSENGTLTHFRYMKCLEDHPASVTYLAEITGRDAGVKVVVKFVTSYGKDVHEFLAREGWAPKLRYYGPLRETGLSNDFPRGPTQHAPPGLRLNAMHMVVMDYVVDAQLNPPEDARAQVKKVLTKLHTQGYVVGDLRAPNILFDGNGQVKFIDFDWCGRYNKDSVAGLQENMDRAQVGDKTYAYYPLTMSRDESMWVVGMEPLTQIQPIHDWGMFDKLPWP